MPRNPMRQEMKFVRTHTIILYTNAAKTPMTTTDSFFQRLRVIPLAMAEDHAAQPDEKREGDHAA
ncbi:hypothetical protein DesfrDRAFT_0184 [Solidesulfovibrio fructosivorans JJ]]|uniref:Uncharacterized protein n=1 Tax=Solidesulfovibrio fructosivorans JJ] TaxID=596151 RepID=E1JRD5_SOLFR|nr:hypothetical protein [Solidesulfovibrio fructosivorans]EFL53136.1 hypothetical protein DesfrDRAFT_0184 [Solidesulfovibrio fructosivorans JJ]]